MAISGLPCDMSSGFGVGLASSNAMALEGIKSGDNLLALISFTDAGVFLGRDKTDFTVAAGTLTGATINLSSHKFVAIWTNAPAA